MAAGLPLAAGLYPHDVPSPGRALPSPGRALPSPGRALHNGQSRAGASLGGSPHEPEADGIALGVLLPRHLPENQLLHHHPQHAQRDGQQHWEAARGGSEEALVGGPGQPGPADGSGGGHCVLEESSFGGGLGADSSGSGGLERAALLHRAAAAGQRHLAPLGDSDGPLERAPSPGGLGRHVSFITAVLMGVALCFHSLLEVGCVAWDAARLGRPASRQLPLQAGRGGVGRAAAQCMPAFHRQASPAPTMLLVRRCATLPRPAPRFPPPASRVRRWGRRRR